MFGFFARKPLLSEDDRDFQIATFAWLLRNFGGDDFYQKTELVLPTRDFFPAVVSDPDQAAIATFEAVKNHAGLQNWTCQLQKQADDIDPKVAELMILQNTPQSAHGTFSIDHNQQVVITYNPKISVVPTQMVATFSHELAHYLTATAKESPPGGWDNWEFATDIGATFLGFGVFQANSAFNFSQYTGNSSHGWSSQRSGYLVDEEHAYALAIFVLLKSLDEKLPLPFLKKSIRPLYKRALRELHGSESIAELKRIEVAPVDEAAKT